MYDVIEKSGLDLLHVFMPENSFVKMFSYFLFHMILFVFSPRDIFQIWIVSENQRVAAAWTRRTS